MPTTTQTERIYANLPSWNRYWYTSAIGTKPYLRTNSTLGPRVEVGYVHRVINSVGGNYKSPTAHSYTIDRREAPIRDYLIGSSSGTGEGGRQLGAVCNANAYPLPPFPDNTALERFYNQLRGEVDLSVAILESGQTVRMLKAVTRLTKYAMSFHPKRIASKWLEYQYGWKPLVTDIYDTSLQMINSSKRCYKTKIRGRAEEKINQTYINKTTTSVAIQEVSARARTEYCGQFRLDDSYLQSVANYSSLNPLSISWELLPFSFVVDWVYDVGSYLRLTESALLYSAMFESGYVHRGTFMENKGSGSVSSSSAGATYFGTDRAYRLIRTKSRSPLVAIPRPTVPRFKADLGSQRLLSAASLLSVHFGRSR